MLDPNVFQVIQSGHLPTKANLLGQHEWIQNPGCCSVVIKCVWRKVCVGFQSQDTACWQQTRDKILVKTTYWGNQIWILWGEGECEAIRGSLNLEIWATLLQNLCLWQSSLQKQIITGYIMVHHPSSMLQGLCQNGYSCCNTYPARLAWSCF